MLICPQSPPCDPKASVLGLCAWNVRKCWSHLTAAAGGNVFTQKIIVNGLKTLCSVRSCPNHCNFDEFTNIFSRRLLFWPLKWRSTSPSFLGDGCPRILVGNTTKLECIWWSRMAYLSMPICISIFLSMNRSIHPFVNLPLYQIFHDISFAKRNSNT